MSRELLVPALDRMTLSDSQQAALSYVGCRRTGVASAIGPMLWDIDSERSVGLVPAVCFPVHGPAKQYSMGLNRALSTKVMCWSWLWVLRGTVFVKDFVPRTGWRCQVVQL